MRTRRLALLAGLLLALAPGPAAFASVLYTYDFPGDPGSGLEANQTNGQPTNATFSDYTRTGVIEKKAKNVFNSNTWSVNTSIDTTQYTSFSITAAGGYHLNLTSLTFDAQANATGPNNGRVALFLNGSATAYATFDYTPASSYSLVTFDFTDLTDANLATTATFRFYGWNATNAGGQLGFDNVVTNGTISNLPEPAMLQPILWLLLGCTLVEAGRSFRARAARGHA
jgi:hypothetical protein